MRTVHEVSLLTGVSIRTLQYYDKLGLLHPTEYTESGYRLYDDTALEKLQQILLFRELEFPLKEIKRIIESPDFETHKALEQQIMLLTLKKEHIESLIELASELKATGVKQPMNFEPFDTAKIEAYAAKAKASWGATNEYKEYEEKSKGRSEEDNSSVNVRLMEIFAEFAAIRTGDPGGENAQRLVKKLKGFITDNYYTCSDEILYGLGKMYGAGGEFTENIDRYAGEGTAAFACRAIAAYCKK